jgi:hypothetical protein
MLHLGSASRRFFRIRWQELILSYLSLRSYFFFVFRPSDLKNRILLLLKFSFPQRLKSPVFSSQKEGGKQSEEKMGNKMSTEFDNLELITCQTPGENTLVEKFGLFSRNLAN